MLLIPLSLTWSALIYRLRVYYVILFCPKETALWLMKVMSVSWQTVQGRESTGFFGECCRQCTDYMLSPMVNIAPHVKITKFSITISLNTDAFNTFFKSTPIQIEMHSRGLGMKWWYCWMLSHSLPKTCPCAGSSPLNWPVQLILRLQGPAALDMQYLGTMWWEQKKLGDVTKVWSGDAKLYQVILGRPNKITSVFCCCCLRQGI